MLDASKGLAPGDPARMAQRIIESVEESGSAAYGTWFTGIGKHYFNAKNPCSGL
jgi:hypothetical protein